MSPFDTHRKVKHRRSTVFLFHDVDLLPENDYNAYECEKIGPRHLAPAVDELRYL